MSLGFKGSGFSFQGLGVQGLGRRVESSGILISGPACVGSHFSKTQPLTTVHTNRHLDCLGFNP